MESSVESEALRCNTIAIAICGNCYKSWKGWKSYKGYKSWKSQKGQKGCRLIDNFNYYSSVISREKVFD